MMKDDGDLLLDRRYIESPCSLQDERGRLLQLQSLACIAGLLLATRLFLLSAEVGISAVYVRPSGLKYPCCSLVMVPASFS